MNTIKILILISLFAGAVSLNAQNKNNLFIEAGGSAIVYSINYDRLITDNLSIRGGLSYLKGTFFFDYSFTLFPVSVNYLVGSGDSKLELGAGVTFYSGELKLFGLSGSKDDFLGNFIIGYRYQPSDGGFIFRAAFTPIYSQNGIHAWGGLSIGTAF